MGSADRQGGQCSWLRFECFMQGCAGAGDLPRVLWGKAENLLVWGLECRKMGASIPGCCKATWGKDAL